jgi:sulfoquinovosyltransferase
MMKGEALSQAYASADIFIMPSESETLGFVVLEAMASGVPVVAVAAGGLTDIITQPGGAKWSRSLEGGVSDITVLGNS